MAMTVGPAPASAQVRVRGLSPVPGNHEPASALAEHTLELRHQVVGAERLA